MVHGRAGRAAEVLRCHVEERKRHISMIRSYTLADFFTIGNASCGTIAIFLCLDYLATGALRFLWAAFILLPCALALEWRTATSRASTRSASRCSARIWIRSRT